MSISLRNWVCLMGLWAIEFSYAADVTFSHFSTHQGLSENTVNAICQDHSGYIWLGTRSGLNQFDGYNFRNFLHDPVDSLGLSSGFINTLVEDLDGVLWIGTDLSGLSAFHPATQTFQNYQSSPDSGSLPDGSVYCLFVDVTNQVWAGTESGLALLNRGTGKFTTYLPDESIRCIVENADGTFWLGTNQGLIHWSLHGIIERYPGPDPHESSRFNEILDLIKDHYGNLWIAALDGGLICRDVSTRRFIQVHPGQIASRETVYSLHIDRLQTLWIGLENGGVFTIDLTRNYVTHSDASLCVQIDDKAGTLGNRSILDILEDVQGNIWLGTYWDGLYYHFRTRKPFVNYTADQRGAPGLSHNHVQCFLEDAGQMIWIGTDGGGLNSFNPETESFIHYQSDPADPYSLSSNHVLDICFDSSRNIWLATWNGLNYFDTVSGRFRHFQADEQDAASLSNSKVMCVHVDWDDNVWVGTLSGLNRMDAGTQSFDRTFSGDGEQLSREYIQELSSDADGNLWVLTAEGVYCLARENLESRPFVFEQYTHDADDRATLSSDRVLSFTSDNDGRSWAGTLNGLNLWRPEQKTFERYSLDGGPGTNWISSVIDDGQGHLWMGTHQGISKMDLNTLAVHHFNIHDGLGSSEYGAGVLKTRKGELYFGGKNGFTRFDPEKIHINQYVPPVVLTDFQVFNESIPVSQYGAQIRPDSVFLELDYAQNVLSFEFAALDYTSPVKNQYQYRLEGFDTQWQHTGAGRRFVTYTNLREGHYLFRVKGSNSDGVWNNSGLKIAIHIRPPVWRTPLALVCYIFLVVGVLLAARELIVYRERLKNEIEAERKEAERVHALDVMKLRFFTHISHEFRTPLTLISGLLEKLYRSVASADTCDMTKHIQMVHQNSRKLLRLVNQIMDIRKLDEGGMPIHYVVRDVVPVLKVVFHIFEPIAEQRKIDFKWTISEDAMRMPFDSDKLEKIINNLISNAFKFTPERGHVEVRADRQPVHDIDPQWIQPDVDAGSYLLIKVSDSGVGIAEEHLNHIFDPFFQVEKDNDLQSTGTGIGLALTYELVQLHQGFVRVESEAGKGSVFTAGLPVLNTVTVSEIHSGAEDDEKRDLNLLPISGISDYADDSREKPLVLLVDDDDDFCQYVAGELTDAYRVQVAHNGKAAWNAVQKLGPDLIISDIRMPEMTGFQLCELVKSQSETAHIPVILLTSQTQQEKRLEGFERGADAYIDKPFEMCLLQKRIDTLIQSQKRMQAKYSHEIYLQPRHVTISSEDEKFLTQIIEQTDMHLENADFGVRQLGEAIGIGRVQLYRRIKQLTELTPTELIRSMRLKRGAQYLKESQLTISEVAYRSGFKEVSYFCKCFKDYYGMVPSEFMKSGS